MYIKVSVLKQVQFKWIPSVYHMLFGQGNDIHYIGGAEVLPPPLEAAEEAENVQARAEREVELVRVETEKKLKEARQAMQEELAEARISIRREQEAKNQEEREKHNRELVMIREEMERLIERMTLLRNKVDTVSEEK